MEPDYSNREINEMVKDVKEALVRIENQTIKTNGRVSSLEKWMWMVIGGMSLLAFLIGQKLLSLTSLGI